jgi:8-oxo-dGTP diphosphatase
MNKYTYMGVYALIKKEDKILLIKKSRGPYIGKLDLPGGGFEFGETPLETLHREVKEETGLIVAKAELLDVISQNTTYINTKGEERTIHHIGIIYSVEIGSNDDLLKDSADGEDSLGAEWVEISSLKKEGLSPFANRNVDYLGK